MKTVVGRADAVVLTGLQITCLHGRMIGPAGDFGRVIAICGVSVEGRYEQVKEW